MKMKHIFICTNVRPELAGASCGRSRSNELLFRLRQLAMEMGIIDRVRINATDCLGPCEKGPTAVVYPEGHWYAGLQPEDAEEFLRSTVVEGRPLERRRMPMGEESGR